MINRSDFKKYFLDFLVVFLGILSSFGIDNYIKNVQKENQKNILLDELYLSINDDIIQLKISHKKAMAPKYLPVLFLFV